jgi:hypothetical protein
MFKDVPKRNYYTLGGDSRDEDDVVDLRGDSNFNSACDRCAERLEAVCLFFAFIR